MSPFGCIREYQVNLSFGQVLQLWHQPEVPVTNSSTIRYLEFHFFDAFLLQLLSLLHYCLLLLFISRSLLVIIHYCSLFSAFIYLITHDYYLLIMPIYFRRLLYTSRYNLLVPGSLYPRDTLSCISHPLVYTFLQILRVVKSGNDDVSIVRQRHPLFFQLILDSWPDLS